MKNKGILPDTCAWIEYLRPAEGILGQYLVKALAGESVYICGPVLYELIQGLRSEKELNLLIGALGALPHIEMNAGLWVKAGQLSASLRKAGKTIPFSDILIAALAIEYNLTVLTQDEHFQSIPGLLVQTT